MSLSYDVPSQENQLVKGKSRFSLMLEEIEAVREHSLENLKIARSIGEALIGPCASKQMSEKR